MYFYFFTGLYIKQYVRADESMIEFALLGAGSFFLSLESTSRSWRFRDTLDSWLNDRFPSG